jgi:uncharacterized cupredoxin-like copper-binding protein
MRYVLAIVMASAVMFGAFAASPVLAGSNGEKVSMEQVPAPVKATIEKEAKGAGVADVTKESKDGKTYYEAQIKQQGLDRYVQVAPDGKVLKRLSSKEEAKDEMKSKTDKK